YPVSRRQYAPEVAEASSRLNVGFGGVNTTGSQTSSRTTALAVRGIQGGQRSTAAFCLAATALLGTAFLVIKGFEYYGDYAEKLMPGLSFDEGEWRALGVQPQRVVMFLLLYYILTLIHAFHLIIGIVLVAVLADQTHRGRFGADYNSPVEVGGLYWHFVDVIWLFLLPLLYLVSARGP